jgi:hypothetical protein
MLHPVFSSIEEWLGRMPFGEGRGRIYRTAAPQRGSRLPRQIKKPYELLARRLRRAVQEEETASLTGPLSLLLWTLLSCSFFLKVGVALMWIKK